MVRAHAYVAALVQLHAQLLQHPVFHRPRETHRQQHQVHIQRELRAGLRLERGRRTHSDGVQLLHVAVFVAGELHGAHAPIARAAFLVRALHAQLHRPQRPRRGGRARLGRLGEQLKLSNGPRALAMAGAQAIGAGVAAADDHYPLAGGEDLVGYPIAFANLILLRQKRHGEMDTLQLAAGQVQIARLFGAAGQQNRVKFLAQIPNRNVAAHMSLGLEPHSLGAHLLQPPVDEVFLHLEIRNAVAQQAADAVVFFEYRDLMSRARQLLRSRQSGRPGADHGHALARAHAGWFRFDETLFEAAVHDGLFNLLDGDRRFADPQNTGGFAGRWTNPSGEFGKVIGGMQLPDGFAPAAAIHQVVPVRNDVGERTAGVAKGHAAIHAARRLRREALFRKRLVDFEPVLDARGRRAALRKLARVFQEAGGFPHYRPPATGTDTG